VGTSTPHRRTVRRSQRGATIVEYILLVCLIAVACLVAVSSFGSSVHATLTNSNAQMTPSASTTTLPPTTLAPTTTTTTEQDHQHGDGH
jgi:Flp pilus assembly pilin Flp